MTLWRLPPLVTLRAFSAVARKGSVRAAAAELSIDHSVISRHVAALQRHLGIRLVNATSHGMELTEAGRRYGEALAAAFDSMEAATGALTGGRPAPGMTIWCVPGLALHWLAPRLGAFHRLHPGIEVALRSTEEQPDWGRGTVDGLISYDPVHHRLCRSITLIRPRVFPVASPAWIARHPSLCDPAGLLRAALIHEDSAEQWQTWFATLGIAPTKPLDGLRLWHSHLALEAARHGQGVALANTVLVRDDLASGRLREVGQSEVFLGAYEFMARRDRWNDAPLRQFRLWLQTELRRDAPVGGG